MVANEVFFLGVIKHHREITDPVVITHVIPVHYNMCGPTYVGQLVLFRTRYGDYKRCSDEVL